MMKSETLGALAAALAKAQGEFEAVPKLGDIARAWDIGIKGHGTYEWHACIDCGLERWTVVLKGCVHSLRCYRCAPKARGIRAADWHTWKGGRSIDNGYVKVYLPDDHPFASMRPPAQIRYVHEHRLVMAEHLGRPLQSYEIVHHKDGNRSNNDISNLELTTKGKHTLDHSKGYHDGFSKGYADGLAAARKEIRDATERKHREAS